VVTWLPYCVAVGADSTLGTWHSEDVSSVSDVSEVHAASIL
jgi:hypothetical protein